MADEGKSFIIDLNKSIKNISLSEFSTTSINCALIAAEITKAQSIQYCVTFTPYVTLLFLQILAYTHVANEIIIQSTAIATAAYDSEWYHFNDEYKKRLLFLIIRAQKPLSMNIGSFGPMTKETALFMIRAVYSYIAFFNNSD
ncbi:odorant receptor 30a-like [Sitophilus oryzae]|uniref:Odorant receptor 30a-like n=1 Tax=Sitophilus oryzae TaxID=7048 RepID=A0A6J2X6Y3_SITOR|nr:odorant receptor 30a-like [Sitophilus oryzae]